MQCSGRNRLELRRRRRDALHRKWMAFQQRVGLRLWAPTIARDRTCQRVSQSGRHLIVCQYLEQLLLSNNPTYHGSQLGR